MADIYVFPEDKGEKLKSLAMYTEGLTADEDDLTAALANSSALLNLCLERINWVGFYLMKNGELVLGPFQGKPACVRIKPGKGVCGTAVSEDKAQLVADVHDFPGHIACDADSRSELVIPIHNGKGLVCAVLDIDSPETGRFSEAELTGLEATVKILEKNCFINFSI